MDTKMIQLKRHSGSKCCWNGRTTLSHCCNASYTGLYGVLFNGHKCMFDGDFLKYIKAQNVENFFQNAFLKFFFQF